MNKLLSSVQYVADHSDHVTINHDAIDKFAADFQATHTDHWMKACPFEYHPLKNIEDEIDRWFLADAMAYCFWGYPTKWTIEYKGQKIDGWWALLATFQNALENRVPLLDGKYLANISEEDAHSLFKGTQDIPLSKERLDDLHQIGNKLLTKFSGRFHNYLLTAPLDATRLTISIAEEFTTFKDLSIYKGQEVMFYKKAQLLVHDLVVGFPKSKFSLITGLDKLTGEADYKVPAILRKFEILQYSSHLASLVDSRTVLQQDSNEEIEIRANMLVACNSIVQKLKPKHPDLNSLTLDGILWVASQKKSSGDKPYHLTLTTDY